MIFLSNRSALFEGSELKDRIKALLHLDAQSYTTPQEFFDRHAYVFRSVSRKPYLPGPIDREKTITADDVDIINHYFDQVSTGEWTESGVNWAISKIVLHISGVESLDSKSETDLKEIRKANAAVSRYLRWVITGGQSGPGVPAIAELIGRNIILERLREAEGEFKAPESERRSSDEASRALSPGYNQAL